MELSKFIWIRGQQPRLLVTSLVHPPEIYLGVGAGANRTCNVMFYSYQVISVSTQDRLGLTRRLKLLSSEIHHVHRPQAIQCQANTTHSPQDLSLNMEVKPIRWG